MAPSIPVPRRPSRSRAFWELSQKHGVEGALESWPTVVRDLHDVRLDLGDLPDLDERRQEYTGGYREAAGENVALGIRSSERARAVARSALGTGSFLIALGVLIQREPLYLFVHLLSGGLSVLTGLVLLQRARRARGHVLADARGLRVRRGDRVELDVARDEIAYVEPRPLSDPTAKKQLGRADRFWFRQYKDEHRVLCAVTTDGAVHVLGPPVDLAAADALCVAIEDRLELLPSQDVSQLRVRVSAQAADPIAHSEEEGAEYLEPSKTRAAT